MALPADVAEAIAPYLKSPVRRTSFVGGGCIAHATRLDTDDGSFFLKYGRGAVAQTFSAEAAGLRALRGAESPLLMPAVLAAEDHIDERPGFLLMEWIEPGSKGDGFWEAFGHGLAVLHRHTAEQYGFDQDNFIGRLPQHNAWANTWPAFFRLNRLGPQAAMARKAGHWRSAWEPALHTLENRLANLLPEHPPASLLHGDLWSGNFLVTATGWAALIDPAVYYGHREADLAMTELFGGFSDRFYHAYREAWPLESGYEERREIYNLYHLINHLNLFGSSYAGAVTSILKRFA